MTATAIYLAVGSTALTDAVDLMDPNNISILREGVHFDAWDEVKPADTNRPDERSITLDLTIGGATADVRAQNVRAIEQKLYQAQRAAGRDNGVWIGTPVCLWIRLHDSTNYLYFTVKRGLLTPVTLERGTNKHTLQLTILAYGSGDVITDTVSGTITNGTGSTFYRANVPGDRDALCKITLTDVSAAAGLAVPSGIAVTTATTGGTLAAATYSYRVAALGSGTTITTASTGVTVTSTGATSSNTVSWSITPGATGYQVFGRTSGSELLMATLNGMTYQWVDNGTVTPAGALPGANTSKHVINRFRVGRRSAPGLLSTDFTPIIAATAVVPTTHEITIGTNTGGTFTLTFGANTTAAIPWNASAQRIQTDFTAIASVGAGNCTFTGSGSVADPWKPVFAGTLAAAVQATITGSAASLTGGSGFAIRRTSPAVFTDATSMNGANTVRQTLNGTFHSVATFTQPAGAYQTGTFDAYLKVRDTTAAIGAPFGLTLNYDKTAGNLAAGSYTVVITQLDGSLNEGPPSVAAAIVTPFTGGITVSWTPTGSYVLSRIYYLGASGTWKYYLTSASVTSYTISTDAGTTGTPPTGASSAAGYSQMQVYTAVSATNPKYVRGNVVSTAVGNSVPELVYLGPLVLAPMAEREDLTLPAWQVLIQARTLGTSGTLDIDGLYLIPHDESQILAESTSEVVQRTWVIDTRRDLRSSVLLTDGTNNQGQASKRGRFTLGPGNNQIVIVPECVGGAVDVVTCKYTAQLTITPRYILPRGLL